MKNNTLVPANLEALIDKYGYCVFDINLSNKKEPTEPLATQYNIVMMCHSGEMTIEANMRTITIKKGDCLSLVNMIFMRILSMSDDFQARVLMCSRRFAIDSIIGIPIEYVESITSSPIINMEGSSEWTMFGNFLENLYLLQLKPLLVKHHEVTAGIYRSMVILLAQYEMRRNGGPLATHFSQSDLYFRQFIDLIYEKVDKEHEVSYYAEQLGMSPKYLNEICKHKSGHKAKEVISAFLLASLKRELLTSGKSAKVIAYEYGFADQSSMGKFFNKMTGMSPSDFKLENL